MPPVLSVVEATVVGSFLNGVFVSWEEGEGGEGEGSGKKKTLCARMTPGKMYLNGRRNLQNIFRYRAMGIGKSVLQTKFHINR